MTGNFLLRKALSTAVRRSSPNAAVVLAYRFPWLILVGLTMDRPVTCKFAARSASKRRPSSRRGPRRLRCEALEPRQLLTAGVGEGDGDVLGPVSDSGDGEPSSGPFLLASDAVLFSAYEMSAASAANPSVLQVELSSAPVPSLTVTFSDDVNLAGQIADGSVVTAVSLFSMSTGPVSLQAGQFAYDPAAWKLTLTLTQPLVAGTYELRLDGSKIQNSAGEFLLGGRGGLDFAIPTFAAPTSLQASGGDLKVDGYAVPSLADWNNDGLTDLIVGEKTAAGTGKIRVYLNSGTNAAPAYGSFVFAQGNDGDVSVPAIGCLGVFPRVFDWNQDGKQDLVLGLADGTIEVLLNENTAAEPRFGTPTLVQVGPPGGQTTCDVGDRATFALVDWNNDGRTDLVLGGLDGKVHVLLNEAAAGVPDFRSDTIVLDGANPLSVSSGRASVAVVDLNDDGRKDLVLGNTEGQLVYFANIGTDASPQFNGSQLLQAEGTVIDLSGIPRSRPFVADVNGDGAPDLLVGALDGLVRQYLGARPSGAPDGEVGDPGGAYAYAFRVQAAANPWQCPVFPLDVNHDGLITPLDALIVINHLNEHGPGTLPVPVTAEQAPPPYLDCSGDREVTALDALLVINDLNAQGSRSVPVAPGSNCEDLPDCQAAGESWAWEAVLDAMAADVGTAGLP